MRKASNWDRALFALPWELIPGHSPYLLKWKVSLIILSYPIFLQLPFDFFLNQELDFAKEDSGKLPCVISLDHSDNNASDFTDAPDILKHKDL